MTPAEFIRQGYQLTLTPGSTFCSVLPHFHCNLDHGTNYCAIGKCVFLDFTEPHLAAELAVEGGDIRPFCIAILQVMQELHPDWPCQTAYVRVRKGGQLVN